MQRKEQRGPTEERLEPGGGGSSIVEGDTARGVLVWAAEGHAREVLTRAKKRLAAPLEHHRRGSSLRTRRHELTALRAASSDRTATDYSADTASGISRRRCVYASWRSR